MTCTVEITLHALSQRSPAESIGKGQKLIEAARPEGAEALSPGRVGQNLRNFGGAKLRITETSVKSPLEKDENRIFCLCNLLIIKP